MLTASAVSVRVGQSLVPGAAVRPRGPRLALVVGGRIADLRSVAEVENFVVVFTSIVVEALPFILIGATVSAAIEVFVSDRMFERVAELPRACRSRAP